MSTNINFVEKLDAGCDTQVSFNLPKTLSLGTVKKSFDNNGLSEAEGCSYLALNTLNQAGLLGKASLIVNPSSFSENTIYADLPANSTLGDLTFTRATDAWRTNSQGLIQRTPWNLFRYSEQFNISPWLMFAGPAVLPNTAIAPNGTLTADTLRSSGGANDFLYQTYTSAIIGLSYTVSIYIKNIDSLRSTIWGANGSLSIFDINWSGSIISSVTNGATFVDVGNGWYRVTHTSVASSTTITIRIYADSFTTSKSVFIWGAQLVEGSSALEYFPTTDRLDVPRIDYSLGGCPNILLEPQRTNVLLNTVFSGSGATPTSWTQTTGTGTSTLTTSTLGAGAQACSQSATAQRPFLTQSFTLLANTTYSYSIYIESISGGLSNEQVLLTGGLPVGATATYFANGVSVSQSALAVVGRLSITIVVSSTGGSVAFRCGIGTSSNQTGTLLFSRPQLELGAYATSYIPTTSASVTRNADSITQNNIFTNGLITAAGGTWFVELRNNRVLTRDTPANGIFLLDSSLSSFGFRIKTYVNARLAISKVIASGETSLFTTTTDTVKLAIKWNGTTADVFQNGVKVVSATAFTPTNMESLGAATLDVPKYINEMALFPTPLTDAECITLTT